MVQQAIEDGGGENVIVEDLTRIGCNNGLAAEWAARSLVFSL
jgi:hypothetical protein